MEQLFPHEVFRLYGIPVRDSVLHTWIMMALIIIVAYLFRRYSRLHPRPWQMLIEGLVGFVANIIEDMIGPRVEQFLSLMGTLMVFIAFGNLFGVLPFLNSPTRDINTTAALALVVFFAIHYYGVREFGARGYIKKLAQPIVVVLPLNIIGQVSRTLSLTLRLFGNVIASEMIVAVIISLVPVFASLPMQLLGMFTGLLQAYVFTVLSCSYVNSTLGDLPSAESTAVAEITETEKE